MAFCGLAQKPSIAPIKVAFGKVERYENFPSQWVQARTVDVWLPEGYTPQKHYAVLYMHDGQMLFDSTSTWNGQEWGIDETMQELVHKQAIQACIVVGIWNTGTGRHADYFPQKPFYQLSQAQQAYILGLNKGSLLVQGPVSDAYLKFVVQELKPFIDTHYATRPQRKHTFMAGSSMGGLISLYGICEYPQIFGGVACLSTHWPGIFEQQDYIPNVLLTYLQQHLPSPRSHRLYFDYGTATLDALYEKHQQKADSLIKLQGYTTHNWQTLVFPGADHSEKAWHKRLATPIVFLLGKKVGKE